MADLRIADAPEIALEDITGNEKVPTGGYGNSAVTITNIGQFAKTALALATENYVSNAVGQKENKIAFTGINLVPNATYAEIPQTNNSVLNSIHQDLLDRMEWIKNNVAVVTDHQALTNRSAFNTHPSSSISHNGTSNVSIEIEELKNDVLTISTETIPELENSIVGKQDVIVNDSNLIASALLSNVPSTNNPAVNASLQALMNRDEFRSVHNNLSGRDVANAHPASSIQDSSGLTQQKINDTKLRLLAPLFGITGDGSNEKTKLDNLFNAAISAKLPVDFCGLSITTAPLTLSGDVSIYGQGGLTLANGSNGTLITTAYNLEIVGKITLDQNKANNSGGTITNESHATINHSGDNLILRDGVTIKPSASSNIVSRAKQNLSLSDIYVDGGMICLYVIAPTAKINITGGEYKNSTLYDNIQILNGFDVVIESIKSHDAARSCIVIGNSTGKARIFGNIVYGAKVDGANQGGWGIVASVNSQDSSVSLNTCYGNQRGCITIDTYPDSGGSVDNRIIVSNNVCNGEYNGTYGTTGIVLNNTKHGNVFGNIIYRVAQGILAVDADNSICYGNTLIDCRDYFLQFVTSHNASFKTNICDGCPVTGAAAIRFVDSNRTHSGQNIIRNLTGAAGFVYRVSSTATGTAKDWTIDGDEVIRSVAGSGYILHVLGANTTGGRVRRCRFKADGVTGWQWYIVSDNLASFSTHDNEVESTGTTYITSGTNVTAGDDTINGSRNFWSSIPTAFKSRIGQVATIANIIRSFDGTNWTSANTISTTYDPPSIPANSQITTNVTVAGALIGDFAQATFSVYDQNIEISATASGTNTVTVKFRNTSASAIDLASGTLRVRVS